MAEAFYKVGDILELDGNASFPRQFGMFPKDAKIRCMVLKCIKPGYEFIIYTLLVYKIDGSFDTVGINQKDIAIAAKRVGHIDISSFLSDEESSEPDYAMFFTAAAIAQAADLRNELDKIKKENEELKAENKKQKVERDEANREISRLRTVIGGLNDVIDDLHTSTVEISNSFSSLTAVLQTDDILEGVNKLKNENKRLNEENGKLEQKISCADKLLAEAANRLYQGRAHLNISAHN